MIWDWLLYVVFAAAFERGYWFERWSPGRLQHPCGYCGYYSVVLPRASSPTLAALLPLLHEEAERLLGPDYITGTLGGYVEVAWGSLDLRARGRLKRVTAP